MQQNGNKPKSDLSSNQRNAKYIILAIKIAKIKK